MDAGDGLCISLSVIVVCLPERPVNELKKQTIIHMFLRRRII
jgi:hypothetical protein